MTLQDAAAAGIARVRLPSWVDPGDYVKLDLLPDGTHGPWGHLYAPIQPHIGLPTPYDFLLYRDTEAGYEAYDGPLHALEPHR